MDDIDINEWTGDIDWNGYPSFAYDPIAWTERMIAEGALPKNMVAVKPKTTIQPMDMPYEVEFEVPNDYRKWLKREQPHKAVSQHGKVLQRLNEKYPQPTSEQREAAYKDLFRQVDEQKRPPQKLPVPTVKLPMKDMRVVYFDFEHPGWWEPTHPELLAEQRGGDYDKSLMVWLRTTSLFALGNGVLSMILVSWWLSVLFVIVSVLLFMGSNKHTPKRKRLRRQYD